MPSSSTAAAIRFDDVTKRFSAPGSVSETTYTAIERVSFHAETGRFISVVGPSGCGKSTLLNLAAGLAQPTEGSVRIHGEILTGRNSRATYMFQQDALLPWKTVVDNIALGLIFQRIDRGTARAKARDWISRVGLDGFESAYPAQLSGGMRKRAAMAQCWIVDPDILLMDEPFSALDVHMRLRMETELLDLWSASPKTVLFVTHDLEEAIGLGDEVIVFSAGPASRVAGRYEVDLPRPRNLLDLRTDRQFEELHRTIWAKLREEVVRSHAY